MHQGSLFTPLSTHRAPDADLFYQALYRAARQRKTRALQLVLRLADTTDLIVLIPDPFDHWPQLCIALMAGRCLGRISTTSRRGLRVEA